MSMMLNAAKKFAMMSSLLDVLLQSFDGITSDMQNMVWGEPERVQNGIGM